MANNRRGGQTTGRRAEQTRARGLNRSELVRSGLSDLEQGFFDDMLNGTAPPGEDLGPDDEADGDLYLDDAEDADSPAETTSPPENEEDDAAEGWTLAQVLGSRPPVVLLRLSLEGDDVKARVTAVASSADAAESLEELALFAAHVFRLGRDSLSDSEWRKSIGLEPAPVLKRYLLLERLAIGGKTKLVIPLAKGTYKFTPNDRGLSLYAAKFAALPDGTPFSLRLLLRDSRGQKDDSDFGALSPFVKLLAVARALERERAEGVARKDKDFRFLLEEAIASLGFDIAAPTVKKVQQLREWLNRNDLPHVFPDAKERQKAYDDSRTETTP